MEEIIRIGMAEWVVSKPPIKLSTLGLGSCVGFTVYDPLTKIGGMIHIMLPSSSLTARLDTPAKFADTGLPLLIQKMEQTGASRIHMVAKMVGGAEMFKIDSQDERLRIGARNIEAVEEMSRNLGIRIIARSVGGNTGKSITLNLEDGSLQIRMISGVIVL